MKHFFVFTEVLHIGGWNLSQTPAQPSLLSFPCLMKRWQIFWCLKLQPLPDAPNLHLFCLKNLHGMSFCSDLFPFFLLFSSSFSAFSFFLLLSSSFLLFSLFLLLSSFLLSSSITITVSSLFASVSLVPRLSLALFDSLAFLAVLLSSFAWRSDCSSCRF